MKNLKYIIFILSILLSGICYSDSYNVEIRYADECECIIKSDELLKVIERVKEFCYPKLIERITFVKCEKDGGVLNAQVLYKCVGRKQ